MERILHVVTYMGRGGIETMLMNYYRHVDRETIQFDFLVHRDFRADFDDEIEALGGHIYRLPPMNPISGSYHKALAGFFQTHPYRVVHCHLNYMSGIVLSAAKRAGIPIRIAHAHTASMALGWKQVARRIFKYLIPATATQLLACSTEAGQAIFGRCRFSILPNAIDVEKYLPNNEIRAQVREELGLGDAFTVIHVGRMVYAKNHEFLLDVFAKLLKINANSRLILVGDGELRARVETKAAQLPESAVLFLGTRTDVHRLLQAADVFAFPSYFEGMPVTMIEAQAAGLPCIKSDFITEECAVTDLVTSLPIDAVDVWVEKILQLRGISRSERYFDIRKSGYDITTAVDSMTLFYREGTLSDNPQ